MDWPVIGILLTLILVLFCLLFCAVCDIRQLHKDRNATVFYLEKYKASSIELHIHLKRFVELADEYELTEKGEMSTMDFVTSITSFCLVLKNRIKEL